MDAPRRNRRHFSDAALFNATASRDGAAFTVFYRRYVPGVLAPRRPARARALRRALVTGALWDAVQVPGVSQWDWLGFTEATHGAALGYSGSVAPANEGLYYTTDAGQSYHRVLLPCVRLRRHGRRPVAG